MHVHGKHFNTVVGEWPPCISPGAQGAGMVRYNTNSNELEVFDGISWRSFVNKSVNISMSTTSSDAIDWAIKKMEEEKLYKELANMYPAVADAMKKVTQAQAELSALVELVK